MEPYVRKIHYYETDKMGFTHHSNYIRFMEEARIDFFEKLGKGYREVEEDGVYSPVMSASCEYKKPTDFGDILEITVGVERLKPLRFVLTYTMKRWRRSRKLIDAEKAVEAVVTEELSSSER